MVCARGPQRGGWVGGGGVAWGCGKGRGEACVVGGGPAGWGQSGGWGGLSRIRWGIGMVDGVAGQMQYSAVFRE